MNCSCWVIFEIITTIALIAGLGFAVWQIFMTKRGNNARVAVELFRELRSPESKNTLRFIYSLKPEDVTCLYNSTNPGNPYNNNEIDSLLDKFDMLGALVDDKIVADRLAVEAYAGTGAMRCWYKLYAYIILERRKRGFFVENYEIFTRRALDYFDNHHMKIFFYEGGSKNITGEEPLNLINEIGKSNFCPRTKRQIEKERHQNNERCFGCPLSKPVPYYY